MNIALISPIFMYIHRTYVYNMDIYENIIDIYDTFNVLILLRRKTRHLHTTLVGSTGP